MIFLRQVLPTTALARVIFASPQELLLYFTPSALPEGSLFLIVLLCSHLLIIHQSTEEHYLLYHTRA